MVRIKLSVLLSAVFVWGCASDSNPSSGDKQDCVGCPTETDPAIVGEMAEPVIADIFGMHSVLLRTGKVLLFAGHGFWSGYDLESVIWDPETETTVRQEYDTDPFCSHHTFLPDGRVLIAAGGRDINVVFRQKASWIVDPIDESWNRVGNMEFSRWYPTLLQLTDGRVLAASGQPQAIPLEIFDGRTEEWTTIEGSERLLPELYPAMRLLPNGDIFTPAIGWQFSEGAALLTLNDHLEGPLTATWTEVDAPSVGHEQGGISFHIDDSVTPPRTVFRAYAGGIASASGRDPGGEHALVEEIDLTRPSEGLQWKQLASMHHKRGNATSVMLPDGNVWIVGGQVGGQWSDNVEHVFPTELYNPETDTWTVTAPIKDPRQYHTTATLLPDGRVLVAAGQDPTKGGKLTGGQARDVKTYEIFSPPYLFRDSRPEIVNVPDTISYRDNFKIEVNSKVDIAKVVFLSPTSQTHHTDTGRFVNLKVNNVASNEVDARAPAAPLVAPPGYYLLFVVDAAGTPSVGKFVQIK